MFVVTSRPSSASEPSATERPAYGAPCCNQEAVVPLGTDSMMLPVLASALLTRKFALAAAAFTVIVLLSGCGETDQPRWSRATPISNVEVQSFVSSRTVYVVASDPGDAAVELEGRVRAQTFVEVLSPENGVLVKQVVGRGQMVTPGEVILEAETAPSEADLLAVQILQLQVDLAVAEERPESEIATAQQAVDDARALLSPEQFFIEATASGLVGLPSSSGRTLTKGEAVILIADPNSLVVEIELTPEQRDGIEEGAPVAIAAATGANTETEMARVGRIIEPDDPTENTKLSVPITSDLLTLGEAVDAIITIVPTAGTAWLPAEAVERRDGTSFVLIADDDGLMRVPVILGRRAGSFVELLEGPPAGSTVVGPG